MKISKILKIKKPDNNNDADKSYTDKCQKYIDFSYVQKIICCYDNKFSKPVQIKQGQKAVYKFIESCLNKLIIVKKI